MLGCFAAAVVLLAAFYLSRAKDRAPLLPLRLIADLNRAGASLTIALVMVGLFGPFLILAYQLSLGWLTPDSSYASTLMLTQILLGLGVGLVIPPCISVATHRWSGRRRARRRPS